jgi:membrane protein DedA with SNARE-associated domain
MHPLTDVARHGYIALAVAVFLEAIGIPIPAAIALIAAGAAAMSHSMRGDFAFVLAVAATVSGDILLFITGRVSGWWLLGMLCRLSLNPESCILHSAQRFHRRGKLTLVLAKFIPGVNTMAPPMAGSMRMPLLQFFLYDLAGAIVYVAAYFSLGFVFSGVIDAFFHRAENIGRAVEWLAIAAALAYIAYRFILYWKHRRADTAPRIRVHELAERLQSSPEHVIIVDLRSHGYYDPGATRISGSVRLEPTALLTGEVELPRDREIYLYCT